MAQRSQRKKTISPETILDDEDFVAVASDDQYVAFCFFLIYKALSFYLP